MTQKQKGPKGVKRRARAARICSSTSLLLGPCLCHPLVDPFPNIPASASVAVTDTCVVLKPTSRFSFGLNERESSQFRTLLRVQVKFEVQHIHHLRSSSCIRLCHVLGIQKTQSRFIHSLTHSFNSIYWEPVMCQALHWVLKYSSP